jgi:hypothetical protein
MIADDATDRPCMVLNGGMGVVLRGITGSVARAVARKHASWTGEGYTGREVNL